MLKDSCTAKGSSGWRCVSACIWLCSQVLVMEYVPGIKINRLDAIDKLGVNRERQAFVLPSLVSPPQSLT